MKLLKYALLIIGCLSLSATLVLAQGGPGRGGYRPDELIIKMLPGYSIELINAKYGTQVKSHQAQTDVYLVKVPAGQDVNRLIAEITAEPGVQYCNFNFYLLAPEGLQRSSPFLDQQVKGDVEAQTAATTLSLSTAQVITDGAGVRIALIDGGVDFQHPWLVDQPGALVSRWDYIDGDSLALDQPGGSCSGHGTFVAGILRLVAPGADIYVYRVLDTSGLGDGYSISGAVLQAIEDSCQILNLSLGMSGVHDGLDDALRLAKLHGLFIVASAGNDSTDLNSIFPFPASRDYCAAVAALDSIQLKADFSNYGDKIDLCAPGTWIYSSYPENMYAWWDGTSFAAPFISGAAALLKSRNPALDMAQIDTILLGTARAVDTLNPQFAGLLGSGLIDLLAALDMAAPFKRGDLTGNGIVDVTDLSFLIAYLTAGGLSPDPYQSGDLNCNAVVDPTDLAILVAFLEGTNPVICPVP